MALSQHVCPLTTLNALMFIDIYVLLTTIIGRSGYVIPSFIVVLFGRVLFCFSILCHL